MWVAVLGWLKGLFGSKGTSQIGSRNQSVSGVTVGDNASGIVVGQGNTVIYPAPAKEPPFANLEKQMPTLLGEMRKDLAKHPLAREFVILNKNEIGPNQPILVYYFQDHSDLRNKLMILQNYDLIHEITYNNTERFRMSEALVTYLTVQSV